MLILRQDLENVDVKSRKERFLNSLNDEVDGSLDMRPFYFKYLFTYSLASACGVESSWVLMRVDQIHLVKWICLHFLPNALQDSWGT